MSKIVQLSENLSNRIAAGEVVERPASVLKELVENAIDAQASEITITMVAGGLETLTVTDNGQGMDKQDLRMSFKRHSTSKIAKETDLGNIRTLGFRGEALPSISSVAKIKAISSQENKAYELVIDNGQEVSFELISHPQGTTIEVSQLFYKLPARLKYMKSFSTEGYRITSLVHNFALGYPEIAFTLQNEKKVVFETKGNGNLLEILFQLYGAEVAQLTRSFEGKSKNFQISGAYVLPHIHRANRYHEFFYLNSRMIQYYRLNQIVHEVFHRMMPSDRFPILVLMIESDARLVDVNVHPSKWQVKISLEQELLDLVKETLLDSLSNELTPKKYGLNPKQRAEPLSVFEIEPEELPQRMEVKQTTPYQPSHRQVIGQHHGNYILAQDAEGLYLYDQHASQERIMYEYFRKKLVESTFHQQELVVPIVVKYRQDFEEIQEKLKEFGILVEPFSKDELIIRSLPTYLAKTDPMNFVNGLFDKFEENETIDILKVNDHQLATMACKASIRFNERRSLIELQQIVDDLAKAENPYHCPHGRPTHVKLDAKALLKEFDR